MPHCSALVAGFESTCAGCCLEYLRISDHSCFTDGSLVFIKNGPGAPAKTQGFTNKLATNIGCLRWVWGRNQFGELWRSICFPKFPAAIATFCWHGSRTSLSSGYLHVWDEMWEFKKVKGTISGGTVAEDFLNTTLILQLKFAGNCLEHLLLNREFQSFVFDRSFWLNN